MFDFSDQVVIVTGGTGKLGSAVIRAFQAAGASLVIPDRGPQERVEGRFPELANSAAHYLAGGVDVTQASLVEKLALDTLERFGQIDVLVNAIGGYRAGTPLHETPLETWDLMLNLNARSIFYTCRAVLPAMLEKGRGKIVNIGARSALSGGANEAAYSASKSAVARLTESMAADYKRLGINVNAVLPAALIKPEVRREDPDAGVTPEEVANVILFLSSDAARIITGALIPAFGTRF
jgi:NAD(P)-dependent dehydrogenase (short-subunit alcohol dehydrogenase family)